jgi:hypothetical protein
VSPLPRIGEFGRQKGFEKVLERPLDARSAPGGRGAARGRLIAIPRLQDRARPAWGEVVTQEADTVGGRSDASRRPEGSRHLGRDSCTSRAWGCRSDDLATQPSRRF